MILLLDSTVLIDHLRGRAVADRLESTLVSGDILTTTAINVDEVARGLRQVEHDAAQMLFDGLVVLPLGQREGWQAGLWRRDFAKRGVTLSQADCLIAAALSSGARLATANPKDFPMRGVVVEHWPVG